MSYPVFKARPSKCNNLMAEVKQPIDRYNELVAEASRLQELQDKAKNKKTKVYLDRDEKIAAISTEIAELEPIKDRKEISKGAKTYVMEWLSDLMYGGVGVSKVETKYMTKGNEVENDNIAVYSEFCGFEMSKNEDTYENEWVKGTPDIVLDDRVVDIKSSWDYTTFPIYATSVPNKDYYAQLQAYMWLTGKTRATLAYVLTNTPEELRRSELDYLDYTQLPLEFRVKEFHVDYDDEFIEKLMKRVERCQQYLNALINQMNWQRYFVD